MVSLEQEIELKKAAIIFAFAVVLLLVVGLMVGKLFFWNNYSSIDPLEKDIGYFQDLVKKQPRNDSYLVELGWLHYCQGDFRKAEVALTSALAINDNNVKAHYVMGLVMQELNKPQKAEQEFKKVISMDPANPSANYSLGRLYVTRQLWEEAVKQLELTVKIDPVSAENHYLLGVAYENKGFVEEAKAAYNQALKLVPDYKEALHAVERLNQLK